jgi:hypothetical protein
MTDMKTLSSVITIALTLLASTAPAAAQQRMPAEFVGKWCPVPMESEDFPAILIYVRGTKCHHPDSDSFLTVTPSGYRAHEEHCALVKSTLDPSTRIYRMRFRCEGEGERRTGDLSMVRAMGVLLVRHHER